VESTLHVLRDCSAAASLWNKFLHPRHFNVFYNQDFSSWLSDNLSNNYSPVLNFNWNQIWATITWSLWRWRNDSLFNSSSNIPRNPYLSIYSAIQQYNDCLDLSIVGNEETVKTMRSITWKRPNVGWIKLNTDGSCDVSRVRSGCGGLLRNSDGIFVMGFAKFLGSCSVLRAEACGLLEGLQCASEIGIAKLQIECDSSLLVDAVIGSSPLGADVGSIVRMIRLRLQEFEEWLISHVFRESNSCADFLAAIGRDRDDGNTVKFLQSPSTDFTMLLLRDEMGIGVNRVV